MPSSPNTPAVEAAIQTICQGLQVNGTTFFQAASVEIGKFKDITAYVPACEITLTDDEAVRYTESGGLQQGGVIDDSEIYLIEVTLDMSNGIAVETQLAKIRDSLSKAFMQSATLATPGVAYSGWSSNGAAGYTLRNGQEWRCYRRKLKVRYEYAVTPQP